MNGGHGTPGAAVHSDNTPAATNFANLLFICISLDIMSRGGKRSAPVQLWIMGASAPKVRRKVGLMLRHLGRGGLRQRVTAEWQKDLRSHCHRRLKNSSAPPLADVFEARSHSPCETQS
jgi:hypothetical protein